MSINSSDSPDFLQTGTQKGAGSSLGPGLRLLEAMLELVRFLSEGV